MGVGTLIKNYFLSSSSVSHICLYTVYTYTHIYEALDDVGPDCFVEPFEPPQTAKHISQVTDIRRRFPSMPASLCGGSAPGIPTSSSSFQTKSYSIKSSIN